MAEMGRSVDEHFEFVAPDDIRIKGHRIGIETVVFDYLDGLLPEEIVLRYPTLSLEEVRATIRYYERNRSQVHEYLRSVEEHFLQAHREQRANPPPVARRLRALRESLDRAAVSNAEPTSSH